MNFGQFFTGVAGVVALVGLSYTLLTQNEKPKRHRASLALVLAICLFGVYWVSRQSDSGKSIPSPPHPQPQPQQQQPQSPRPMPHPPHPLSNEPAEGGSATLSDQGSTATKDAPAKQPEETAPVVMMDKYDAENARNCGSVDPLTISALRVAHDKAGFTVTFSVGNTESSPISIERQWRSQDVKLKLDDETLVAREGLPSETKWSFLYVAREGIQIAKFDNEFSLGRKIPPDSVVKFSVPFPEATYNGSTQATVTADILVMSRRASGEPALDRVTFTCPDAKIVTH